MEMGDLGMGNDGRSKLWNTGGNLDKTGRIDQAQRHASTQARSGRRGGTRHESWAQALQGRAWSMDGTLKYLTYSYKCDLEGT